MILSFSFQCRLFMASAVIGLFYALLYHIFYALCTVTNTGRIVKGIGDIIYWCLFAVTFFFFMLKFNSGEVRPFTIAAGFMGMFIYYILLKERTDSVLYPFFVLDKKIILFILNIIKAPFCLVLCPFYRIFNKILIFLKKSLQKRLKYEKITLRFWIKHFLRGEKIARNKHKKKIKTQNKQS